MKWFSKFTALLLALALLVSMPVLAQEENHLKKLPQSAESQFFNVVFGDVVNMYRFGVDENEIYARMVQNMITENPEMLDAFFKALFNSFDDYSEFYLPEEFEDYMNNLEAVTGGIGVYMEKGNPYVIITGTNPGSPAEAAGIKAGDLIKIVDGENVTGKSLDYHSYKLRGEIGTSVTVVVLRNGEELEFTLQRAELISKSVSYGMISADTGYIAIHTFASSTAKEVQDALAQFDTMYIKKIVLDLRDNGGGYVDSAIAIARMLVPAGPIITHYTRATNVNMEYQSYLKETKYNLVTLVNENTASAAEILASALQESGASKLVGAKTFGKAVTQSVFPLYAGRACKLTTGEYFTRNGKKINKVGINPDVSATNKVVLLKNTDIEPLVYCSSYTPDETTEGISGFKKRLRYLNYNVGEINNAYDEVFFNAIYAYQNANGIKPTGVLDITTQIHITNATDDIKVLVDNQLNAAASLIGSDYIGLTEK